MASFDVLILVVVVAVGVQATEWNFDDNLALLENAVLNQGDNSPLSRERRQALNSSLPGGGGNHGCALPIFMRLKGCCYSPTLIPITAFQNCSGGRRGPPPVPGQNVRRPPPPSGQQMPLNHTMGMERFNGGPTPVCFMNCVFKNQSLLTSTGAVDLTALTNMFLANANATWKPVVQAGIANCSANITNLTTAVIPNPINNNNCNAGPGFFMICLQRYIMLNCPIAQQVSSVSCKDDMQRLSSCNPTFRLGTTASQSGGLRDKLFPPKN